MIYADVFPSISGFWLPRRWCSLSHWWIQHLSVRVWHGSCRRWLTTPLIALIIIFFLTLALTELVTNNAAAALMFPIGYGLAQSLGVDVMPFVLAVAFAASGSFLTPYGYATNLIVQNIGGYTRGDYLRFGFPISLAYSVGILSMLNLTYF